MPFEYVVAPSVDESKGVIDAWAQELPELAPAEGRLCRGGQLAVPSARS